MVGLVDNKVRKGFRAELTQVLRNALNRADNIVCIRLVDLAEYKRRQSPPGPKVTSKAFGRDRRVPITNRYRG